MKIADTVAYTLRAMHIRSIRSWLTILGIIVGITAIVVLIGMVQGLKEDVESELEAFGPRTIVIAPIDISQAAAFGGTSLAPTSGKLFDKDYERVKKHASIDVITRAVTGRTNAQFKDEEISASIMGVEPDAFEETVGELEIDVGRFLIDSDSKSVIIGSSLSKDSFEKKVELGSNIYLSGEKFKVVGILKETGTSFTNLDSVIIMTIDDARSLMGDSILTNEISAIRMIIKEGEDVDEAASEINDIMLSSHRTIEDEKDFSLISPSFINEQVEATTGILSLFLGAIASISLLVGGIGIMNTMFMSVLERRREIGMLKAVGMAEREILKLFLTESVLIGVAGGAIGLFIGASLLWMFSALGLPALLIPEIAIGAVLFSGIVGIISGVVPAKQAAKLDPVDALRYE
jgi:putative ABC transport system permease protein